MPVETNLIDDFNEFSVVKEVLTVGKHNTTVWAAVIFSSVIYVVYKLRCKMITSPLTTTLVS